VDRGMAGDVRGIMRQRAQGEGVLVNILTLAQQFQHEVAAANVMHQIAELYAAEGIVAQVLDDGAAIGVGMRLGDLLFRESGIALQKEGTKGVSPEQVNNLFVSQDGIRGRAAAAHEQDEKERQA